MHMRTSGKFHSRRDEKLRKPKLIVFLKSYLFVPTFWVKLMKKFIRFVTNLYIRSVEVLQIRWMYEFYVLFIGLHFTLSRKFIDKRLATFMVPFELIHKYFKHSNKTPASRVWRQVWISVFQCAKTSIMYSVT